MLDLTWYSLREKKSVVLVSLCYMYLIGIGSLYCLVFIGVNWMTVFRNTGQKMNEKCISQKLFFFL